MKKLVLFNLFFILVVGNISQAITLPPIRDSISTASGCSVALGGTVSVEEWENTLSNNPLAKNAASLFQKIRETHPNFISKLDFSYLQLIYVDPEMYFFQVRYVELLKKIQQSGDDTASLNVALKEFLTDEVPASTINKRISGLLHPKYCPDRTVALRRALGENTLDEVQELVYGNGELPSKNSLLGKYLAETGAAKVIRKFRGSVEENARFTDKERLVIAVSKKTFPIYKKYFTKMNFLIHYHTPRQGTLQIAWNGKTGSYGKLDQKFNLPYNGILLPHILLSTTEGQRMKMYSDLAQFGNPYSNYPWLRGGYCKTSGYSSCTHWFGNLPLGDQWTKELKFPGRVDEWADDEVPVGDQIGEVSDQWLENVAYAPGTYSPARYNITSNQNQIVQVSEQQLTLMRQVWRSPTRMQLSELLGKSELKANLRGEYANPGWVAIRLTAHVKFKRMPFIFVAVSDASKPLDPQFDPMINGH